jgi:hypothetical protein
MTKKFLLFYALFIFAGTAARAQSDEPLPKDSAATPADTLKTDKGVFSNLYLQSRLTPAADIRSQDGLFLGLTYKTRKEEFRKDPEGSVHSVTALHSLSTESFILKYKAEWLEVFTNSDITINALADVTGNIMNFYGRGNNTFFERANGHARYYRVNFSYYLAEPALRFNLPNNVTITAGPSFQYYSGGTNPDRFISTPDVQNSFNNIFSDKVHGGASVVFGWDKRDDKFLPTQGLNFELRVHAYEGLNDDSQGYAQAYPQLSFYVSLDKNNRFVLADRIGAGFTSGHAEFYQSAFLGSQDNLLGFRKFRFAGDHLLYNNLEVRVSLPEFIGTRMGLIGFYDVGRVWVKNENSNRIHHGVGGGIYLIPLNRFFIRAIAGYSKEGWQPTVTLRQRF